MNFRDYGFVEVGHWHLKESVKSGITFQLSRLRNQRVLYAFTVSDDPKYIGVCEKSTTSLKDRMGRYQSRAGKGTNKRIAKEIRDSLTRGEPVKILALNPEISLRYRDLHVDLVKGLENPLLDKVRPGWNIHK